MQPPILMILNFLAVHPAATWCHECARCGLETATSKTICWTWFNVTECRWWELHNRELWRNNENRNHFRCKATTSTDLIWWTWCTMRRRWWSSWRRPKAFLAKWWTTSTWPISWSRSTPAPLSTSTKCRRRHRRRTRFRHLDRHRRTPFSRRRNTCCWHLLRHRRARQSILPNNSTSYLGLWVQWRRVQDKTGSSQCECFYSTPANLFVVCWISTQSALSTRFSSQLFS